MFTRCLEDDTLVLLLEPGLGISLRDAMLVADSSRSDLSSGNTVSWSDEDNVEIHAENT